MMYGIKDEPELIFLLGYLTEEQWEDAINIAVEEGRLDKKKLIEFRRVVT